MKTFAAVTALALAFGSLGVTASADEPADSRGEAKLAKMLEGRVAGEPRRCVTLNGSNALVSIDRTALIYKSGSTLWVNRTRNPEQIDDDDVAVLRLHGSRQLCSIDTITLVDRYSQMFAGSLFLDEFVPYRKVS